MINSETTFGGTILVANFLSQFYKKIDYLYVGNFQDLGFLKKILNKNINLIKINSKNSIIKKIDMLMNIRLIDYFRVTKMRILN